MLAEHQDSLSESSSAKGCEDTEEKLKEKIKVCNLKKEKESPSNRTKEKEKKGVNSKGTPGPTAPLYPPLDEFLEEFAAMDLSEEEGPDEDEGLAEWEEEELEEETARYEEERYGPPPLSAPPPYPGKGRIGLAESVRSGKGAHKLQRNLTLKILSLNATKAEFITIGQFSDWMVATFAYIKEWAGVGVLGMLMCAGLLVALLLIVKVMRARQREKVAIMRAFAALEAGASPQAWLSMLKEA